MRASLSSRSSAEASRSAIDCSHWASSAEKTPRSAAWTPKIPKAPVRPRIAAAAVAQPGGVEAPLARPLPDGDGLLAGEHPAGEKALLGGELLGVGAGVDRGAGRGGEPDAVAALHELEDRAVGDAEGLGDDRDGLAEQGLAVGDAEGHTPEASHRGLAARAPG